MKVAAIQCVVGLDNSFTSALKLIEEGIDRGVELFLLPEYFSYKAGDNFDEKTKETLKFLRSVSIEYSCVVCGNVLIREEGCYYNAAHLFENGELIGIQKKIHPTKTERNLKIACGDKIKIFDVRGVRVAILICADILYPELCRVAGLKKADLVLNPVISFKESELPAKEMRNCLYFTRSFDNAYAIVKAGGVGYTFLGQKTVGRSLISAFDGIIALYTDEEMEELIYADVDVGKIEKYREINYSLRDRNTKAFMELLDTDFDC